ncbi:hypothetical protein V490_04298 [Pseudogymnoascus sp. VKM F-3557]|nr:hypothetical protein V490_04298 [Pseudogymnoascus sp. VKM F-3557]
MNNADGTRPYNQTKTQPRYILVHTKLVHPILPIPPPKISPPSLTPPSVASTPPQSTTLATSSERAIRPLPPITTSTTNNIKTTLTSHNKGLFSALHRSSSNPIGLVRLISIAGVVLALFIQFFFTGPSSFLQTPISSPQPPLPFRRPSPSPAPVQAICESSPHPFLLPTTAISQVSSMSLQDAAQRVAKEFDYPDDEVLKGGKHFITQMQEGLLKDGTSMSQIPTYVTGVPNGTEKGVYLAVDLGGTNFRVCSIQLHGDTTFNLTQSKVAIPKELMIAKTAKELFDFLAKQIELFLKEHHEEHFESHLRRRNTVSSPTGYKDEHIFKLGFTFSFPVHQIGINRGTLIRWTKGFDIADAVGKDVCQLLQDAIDALHLPVRVSALVNDTVGTLMSRSYTSPGKTPTVLGAIFGTGTNGAYVEKLANIKKNLEGKYDESTGQMVVNTEWGSFDNELSVLPTTTYDTALDTASVNPGIQMFEKRVSGMFLGELLRLAICSLYADGLIFTDAAKVAETSPLKRQGEVDSSILSVAAADESSDLKTLRGEMETQFAVREASVEDAKAVKTIAYAIGRRAARLAAVAVGAIVVQSGRLDTSSGGATVSEDDIVDIGVDGSLVEFYPGFEEHIRAALRVVGGMGQKGEERVRIGIAKDGSGVGAALIALVAEAVEAKV